MNKREEMARKILGVNKQPPKKMEQKDYTELGDEVHDILMEEVNSRNHVMSEIGSMKPQIMTGDPAKIFGAAGARAGKPCNKSIKSTLALGKESRDEQDKSEDKRSIMAKMKATKDISKDQENGQEQGQEQE